MVGTIAMAEKIITEAALFLEDILLLGLLVSFKIEINPLGPAMRSVIGLIPVKLNNFPIFESLNMVFKLIRLCEYTTFSIQSAEDPETFDRFQCHRLNPNCIPSV